MFDSEDTKYPQIYTQTNANFKEVALELCALPIYTFCIPLRFNSIARVSYLGCTLYDKKYMLFFRGIDGYKIKGNIPATYATFFNFINYHQNNRTLGTDTTFYNYLDRRCRETPLELYHGFYSLFCNDKNTLHRFLKNLINTGITRDDDNGINDNILITNLNFIVDKFKNINTGITVDIPTWQYIETLYKENFPIEYKNWQIDNSWYSENSIFKK